MVPAQRLAVLVLLLLALPALPGEATPPNAPRTLQPAGDPEAGATTGLAPVHGEVSPCENFYEYACGVWRERNPIPADQSVWGRFSELAERNRQIVRRILERFADPRNQHTADQQRIGDYHASCMGERRIEKKGIRPLQPALARIAALEQPSLASLIGDLHRLGAGPLFAFGSEQDFKNASQVIARVDQGGLGLPDREYYLRQDQASAKLRRQYLGHVQRMLQLLGRGAKQAKAGAGEVLGIETELARASLDRVVRRDPKKVYHRMTLTELSALTPGFDWRQYLASVGAPPIRSLNVATPGFFRGLQSALRQFPLDNWKTYLTWQLVHAEAPFLPSRFVKEDFSFYGRVLGGARQLKARWKRCVSAVDEDIGFAVGREYVAQQFGGEAKARTLKMVQALERALAEDIDRVPWMSAETKQRARGKLKAITNNIGYPDRWRDYSRLQIVRGDALGNHDRAARFEMARELNKIDKPVDRTDWQMTPQTVNAYYDPQLNSINFPAGILQPPFYDAHGDEPLNFGGIGAVIGHELTHGFDDEGRQFDAKGNLRDWWAPKDSAQFEQRAGCFVEEYSQFTAVDDVKLNGKLTLGENIADNGGLRIARAALGGRGAPSVDGFSPEQRFFLGWGQVWCQNRTKQIARQLATTDPHSPGEYRVNGVVANMPALSRAFSCHAGQPMVRSRACRVW